MRKLAATATIAVLGFMASTAGATGDWSGFHVAGHADAGWLRSQWSGFDGAGGPVVRFNADNRDTGWGGGVGLGYNFQMGSLVLGAVGDWTWLNADETKVFPGPAGPDAVSTHVNDVGTFRGVVGLAMDSVMPYATGGWAWGDVSRRFVSSDGLAARLDADDGWTAGGGLNVAVGPSTAINLEVLYVDFGSASKTVASLTSEASVHVRTKMTLARIGVDFRF